MNLLPFFEWLEASPIGVFVKDQGATFASIEAVHLVGLALLGGTVFASDLRLLNVVMRDVPSTTVVEHAHRWFKVALTIMLVTGFFMLAGVAVKCYHNPFYWTKMIALAIGMVFVFAVRQPLLRKDHSTLHPLTLKLLALASMSIWFLVAASGRWIGFSG
jgi:hypothetical protein